MMTSDGETEPVVHVAMGYPRDVWNLLMARTEGNPGPLVVSILEGWRSAVEQQDGLTPDSPLTGIENPQPGDVGTAVDVLNAEDVSVDVPSPSAPRKKRAESVGFAPSGA